MVSHLVRVCGRCGSGIHTAAYDDQDGYGMSGGCARCNPGGWRTDAQRRNWAIGRVAELERRIAELERA
jgi:hypothetical protein